MVIDYRSATGSGPVKRLADGADVVVADVGPGRAAELVLGYEHIGPFLVR